MSDAQSFDDGPSLPASGLMGEVPLHADTPAASVHVGIPSGSSDVGSSRGGSFMTDQSSAFNSSVFATPHHAGLPSDPYGYRPGSYDDYVHLADNVDADRAHTGEDDHLPPILSEGANTLDYLPRGMTSVSLFFLFQ